MKKRVTYKLWPAQSSDETAMCQPVALRHNTVEVPLQWRVHPSEQGTLEPIVDHPHTSGTFAALRSLRLGWGPDGNGLPLSERAATLAERILGALADDLPSSVHIVPNTDGGLQLEWYRNGREVEVLVSPTRATFDVFVRGGDRFGFSGRVTAHDLRRLEDEVRWVQESS
jgi:hypothetical protein